MILPASPVDGEQRSSRTSWLAMAWVEGGSHVTMAWKGVLMTCVFCRDRFRRSPWSGNESASVNVSVSGGVSGVDGDVHENLRESGNVYVHFSTMSQVESWHASNGSCVLFPTGSSLTLSSQARANPKDHLRPIDSICLWGRSPCPIQHGCRCCRCSRSFFPVS